MANKRKALKSVLNNQNNITQTQKESKGSPIFADIEKEKSFAVETDNVIENIVDISATELSPYEELVASKNEQTEKENINHSTEKEVDDKIIKEIKEAMAEGVYNQGKEKNFEENDDENEKVFVTNDIPLANNGSRDKKSIFYFLKKKNEEDLSARQQERKAKREAKKAAYKKTTLKHKLYVLSVLLVLGVFTGSGLGVWYFNGFLKSTVDYSQAGRPEDYIQSVDDTLLRNFEGINLSNKESWVDYAQNQNKTPFDLSPVDNFVLAQYNTSIADTYSIIGSGSVVAATIITVDQFMYSEKKFDGQAYSFVSISPDTTGLVGDVAVCDVLEKGKNEIKSYKGSIHEGNKSADWTYNTTFTTAEHSNLNGVKVNDIQPYLICTETVISSSEITVDANGNYVFTLELDTIKSVLNYIKQVKRTGGLATYPEFKSLSIKFAITPDWQLRRMEIVEVYKAVKMGMTPTITGTLNFDITQNQPITLPVSAENN